MATQNSSWTKWRLRKINKYWFLDVSGELKRLNIVDNASEVFLEENIIFADEVMYQIKEESNGEVIITKVKDIIYDDNISESKECDDITLITDKTKESKTKYGNKIEPEHELEIHKEVNTHQNSSNLTQCKELFKDMNAVAEDDDISDDEQKNYEVGSQEYFKKKGKIRGFFKRIKNKLAKKPTEKKTEDPIFEDVSNKFENIYATIPGQQNDTVEDICAVPPQQQNDYSEVVMGAKIRTAIFEFKKFSDQEMSFQKMDKLKILDVMSDDSDWGYAENLTTGEKGFIPLALVSKGGDKLEAMAWWHDISRITANKLLGKLDNPTVGTFLIRPSSRGQDFVLSMLIQRSNKIVRAHYLINSQNGQLFITRQRVFSDIISLVDYYKRMADGLPCSPLYPVRRQIPVIYPRDVVVEKISIEFGTSFQIGCFGEVFRGKLFKMVDATVLTHCKCELEPFLADASIMFKFRQSKHIVRMLAVVLKPEPFMIVLGETVQDTLQNCLKTIRENEENELSFSGLTKMASEIAGGMAFLEEKGIVHGNLKAENVLICELTSLKIIHPQLIQLLSTSDNTKLAKDNDCQWTAPEVLADVNALSTKSDVWSFGVLMYEMITFGQMPYKGMEKEKTTRGLSEGLRLAIPKGDIVHCPVEFYMTILQCWHKNPECRLTFDFLADLLYSFKVAIQSEYIFKDESFKFKYMTGTLQNEQGCTDPLDQATVYDESVEKDGQATYFYKSHVGHDKSETNDDVENVEKEEQSTQETRENANLTHGSDDSALYHHMKAEVQMNERPSETINFTNGVERSEWNMHEDKSKTSLTPGFNAIAIYNYEAADDGDISFLPDDIITNIEPIDEGWWIGTTRNGERGIFPAKYVEVYENQYSEVTKLC